MPFEIPPFDMESPTLDDARQAVRIHSLRVNFDESGCVSFYWQRSLCFFDAAFQQAYFPLAYDDDTELKNRSSFDKEYLAAKTALMAALGEPSEEGRHVPSHRPVSHYYQYAVWPLEHCRLALAQDEFDIQYGLDLSLRFLYKAGPAERLIYELGNGPPDR